MLSCKVVKIWESFPQLLGEAAHGELSLFRGGQCREPLSASNNANSNSPTQQGKVMYNRPKAPTNISPAPIQSKLAGQQQVGPSGATLTRIPNPQQNQQQQQPQAVQQPLKTINLSAIQQTPTLPDATLTPLNPQTNSQITAIPIQTPPQPIQVFATTTQLPPPNISITPTVVQPAPKKDEPMAVDSSMESKG